MTSDDLSHVLEEVVDISARWYQLGLQLGVKPGTLDRIRAQFSDPRDQLLEMLKTWLESDVNCSWKTLVEALRSRSVETRQLAEVLETKYCTVEETEVGNSTSGSDHQPETSPMSELVVPTMIPQSREADTQGSKWSSDIDMFEVTELHEHNNVCISNTGILVDQRPISPLPSHYVLHIPPSATLLNHNRLAIVVLKQREFCSQLMIM